MIAKHLRSFAAGLIFATGVCAVVYFTEPNEAASTSKVDKQTTEQMKSTLKSSGYVIFTEEEWQGELSKVESKQNSAQEQKDSKGQKPQEKTEETVIYRTILNVASGMTSIDVGHALVQGKIIDDAKTFFNEVEKRGLSNGLRPGTYELESTMTMDEVLSIMFK